MKIVITATGLTQEDFVRSGCNEAISSSPRHWISDYLGALNGRMADATGEDDEQTVKVCRVLYALLASRPQWETRRTPAEETDHLETYEFDETVFSFLAQVLTQISDDETRGRAADLLYQRSIDTRGRRDIDAARIAIRSYLLEASRHQTYRLHWTPAFKRIERSLGIANEIRDAALKQEIIAHIESTIFPQIQPDGVPSLETLAANIKIDILSRYPIVLMDLMFRSKEGTPDRYGPLAEQYAYGMRQGQHRELEREYLEIASKYYRRARNRERELTTRERSADSSIEEAKNFVARNPTLPHLYIIAEDRLMDAIRALKTANGIAKEYGFLQDESRLEERIDKVRRQHLDYQQRGMAAFVPSYKSNAYDAGPMLARFEGISKLDAISTLAAVPLRSKDDFEQIVGEMVTRDPMFSHFGPVVREHNGHIAAQTKDTTANSITWPWVCSVAVESYEDEFNEYLGPIIDHTIRNHAIIIDDVASVVQGSYFIPDGRALFFIKGLLAGFRYDVSMAVHLLAPQIEHASRIAIRNLISSDIHLTKAHGQMLSDPEAPSLPQALQEPAYAEMLSSVLGEEIVFTLRVILVERFGGNLRHRAMHGLATDGELNGPLCWYFWFVVLKICCMTIPSPDKATNE
ncbi:hypothetical protein CCAX7_60440 [Capsulimonas corticalis]|uniref:DUF4209 domain-containing protein n=1 Tax=Capsulimonas corticalis TaxID=2219043 RepID=A0A9N7LAU5_9BACT|nr:DUF4209 domain-containing protein [Capsulimonas corticalis]BDI33993.1 hypothetical protein CCAX7_60440 [Capsulimonas corticalis]